MLADFAQLAIIASLVPTHQLQQTMSVVASVHKDNSV